MDRVSRGSCDRTERSQKKKITNTMDEVRFRVSKRRSARSRVMDRGRKLTEITQDGADEGRLNDTKLAFHERKDLQNRLSDRGVDTCSPRHARRQ